MIGGSLRRQYSGSDSLVGLVVADGLTQGSCVACTAATTEPIGICITQSPSGECVIAGQGEHAFAYAGADIAFDASGFACVDSSGKVISFNPATAETAGFQVGNFVRPEGANVAEGALVEVAVNIVWNPAAGGEA